ncbi:hypothetical protein HQ590_10570 [bacterium]|nr:hypothetical protein [bacterium]
MIPRGFPDDLPVRPAHMFELDWFVTQRNQIHIWAPEGVTVNGRLLWFLLREPPAMQWTAVGTEGWESRFEVRDRCRVAARELPRDDGIDLELEATNLGPETWQETQLTVCVQLAAAPDFRDPELERTYYHTAPGWRKFDPRRVHRSAPGRCHFYGTDHEPPETRGGRPEIRVASVGGQWHLAHWFREAAGVFGNCQPGFCCVHANPVVGTVPPGATGAARGWLRIRRGAVTEPPLEE